MFFPILDIINLTLTSCAFCTNFCIKKSNQLNWGSLNAMMKMNELYLFFFKNWLKSDWNIFIIKKSWCLLICNLQPLNHPKTQIPSSINPTFYFSLLWNALLHMCTQCKQMEMCNSAVLSLNDRAISKYDDDLHYFVLDCKKTTKYYAQNTAQICTICNVLALNKNNREWCAKIKKIKAFFLLNLFLILFNLTYHKCL